MSSPTTTFTDACFIDGAWVPMARTFPVTDPATGEVVGHAADAAPEDATRAVDAASRAFPAWAALPARERGMLLKKLAAVLLDQAEPIADLVVREQGKPKSQALFEVRYATEWLEWYGEEARRNYGEIIPPSSQGKRLLVLRQPMGVAVAITPWNFPVAMIARKLAPALAAGCTLVVKPAEQTPLSAVALFQAIDAANFPPGVVNLVTTSQPAPVVAALLDDPRVRKITFTGSTEVGKLLVAASARNLSRVSLELGGQAPFIVFEDADLDAAVEGFLASKFQVNGQSCLCANRVYVQRPILKPFTDQLVAAVRQLRVGPGSQPDVDIGPLIDGNGYRKVVEHVDDAVRRGARVACGGHRIEDPPLNRGYFFAPTILTGATDDMLVAREETFGPVAPVLAFDDEQEVVERANATVYGLAAYVYTRDLARVLRVGEGLEFGIVGINDPRPATPSAPFGGFKQSGVGREGGHEGMEAFLETKLLSIVL